MAWKAVDLSIEIKKILDDYSAEASEEVKEAVKTVTKKTAKKVRQNAKSTFNGTGAYAKGWTSKVEVDRMSATGTIYNKNKPWLAHLLENGHAKRGGGRVAGRPHIKPAEEEAKKELVDEIERRLS